MELKPKVLIVDDSLINRSVMKKIVADHYRLAMAESGEEALAIAHTFQPDLVLLDIMMPGIDGFETCRRLRADTNLTHTKVIMVSAKTKVSERLEGYEAGADDYITKPFDKEEMLAKMAVYSRLCSMEEVSQLGDNLLQLLSHELNTPLNGIIPVVDMMLDRRDMPEEERCRWLHAVKLSADRLHGFISKCLKLSALRSGQTVFALQTESLSRLVEGALDQVSALARARQVTIQAESDGEVDVNVNAEEIMWVLRAILENAIRFSPEGESVSLACCADSEQVTLTVLDKGPGFDEGFLPYVFNPFSVDHIEHHTEGHGLSMAIAHQIVNAHGGQLYPANNDTHAGALITVRLPLASCACKTAAAV